jgi:thiaminase/transcriptional activator TenA
MEETQAATPTRFTEELRAKAGDQWNRVVHHKFTKELAAGTIDTATVLKRYLIQDHRFLDSFVVLLASIIAYVPTLEDRIPGCQFLAVITGPENTYFERSYVVLGITEEERSKTPDADATKRFCKLMRDAASSQNLEEMLAVIVVCEWSYLSWGQAVLAAEQQEGGPAVCRKNFWTSEWVDLHSGPAFEAVIAYLRNLLDREGERLKAAGESTRLENCEKRFLEAVGLEEDFFDFAYRED